MIIGVITANYLGKYSKKNGGIQISKRFDKCVWFAPPIKKCVDMA